MNYLVCYDLNKEEGVMVPCHAFVRLSKLNQSYLDELAEKLIAAHEKDGNVLVGNKLIWRSIVKMEG